MTSDIETPELCERYERLYTGALTDVLDDHDIVDQTLHPDIAPLTQDMRTAGVAYPVVGRPNRAVDDEENIRNILEMFGDAPEDSVLMYDTNDDRAAHIGELSVTSLKARGCRGAVVDGGARDVAYILERDFPVFARYNTPADAVPRWEILDWGVDAVVGGIEVSPGDVVVGDVDGVVVVPEAVREEILLEAEELVDTENEVREAVRDGTLPINAYDEFGEF
ncbi:RraA family protein [Halobellus limi]|uniref:Regulator of RNase E activity RraA n=1 Tax=Halobellus limi TaxID=699433 RepID=A0A1H6BQS8_9EURY|nr:RraA family protein [Halobellus limi]QCC49375.1 RraA family protein [Halobellus limi]SEG62982.1 Regulator of RNase E activity RraA [Halobellus limi]